MAPHEFNVVLRTTTDEFNVLPITRDQELNLGRRPKVAPCWNVIHRVASSIRYSGARPARQLLVGGLGRQCSKHCQWFAGMGQAPHLRNWVLGKGVHMRVKWRNWSRTEKWGYVCTKLVYTCRYTNAAGQTKIGVRRIPIPEIQAMIACKNCVWLVGWLVGSVDCGRMDGQWLVASRFVCYLVCQSVEPSGRLAIQPTTEWLAIQASIRPLTNQPNTVLLQAINAWISGIRGSTYPRFRSAGWLRWCCLTHACMHWSILGSVLSSLSGGYAPPRFDEQSPDRSGNTL